MASPLEIGIALHYYTTPTEYDGGCTEHYYSPATQGILSDFVTRGLLVRIDPANKYGGTYKSTEGLEVWVRALCDVPLPIQRWVIPSPSDGERTP